jgi:hypothetical protein
VEQLGLESFTRVTVRLNRATENDSVSGCITRTDLDKLPGEKLERMEWAAMG